VRDRERRSGMVRKVSIWRVISGGRELSCGMVVGGKEGEDGGLMYRR
jgi:hypothetical protein